MKEEMSKKVGVVLLLAAIFLAILLTFSILNYFQVPQAVKDIANEPVSGGETTLTVQQKDESTGTVSLELLPPPGGKE